MSLHFDMALVRTVLRKRFPKVDPPVIRDDDEFGAALEAQNARFRALLARLERLKSC